MPDQQIQFVIKATNTASPEFAKVSTDLEKLTAATRAYGTATPAARVASAQFLDSLKATRAAAGDATIGLTGLGNAAKGVASGGLQNLLSAIPGVGGALANLAGQLGGFPLLLGGLVGAGAGVLKFLQSLGAEADAALAKSKALADGLGTSFRQTMLEVQKLRAEGAGDKTGALEAQFKKEQAAIEDTKTKRIAAAKAELDALDIFGRKRTELSQAARDEIVAAEGEAANQTILIQERKRLGLKKLDDDRLADEKKNRDEAVKAEAEAAAKQEKLIEDLTAKSLTTFKKLGPQFADVTKGLELTQFLKGSEAEIATLNAAIEQGIDTHGRFSAGVAALREQMQDAIRLGYVPTTEAAKETSAAVEAVAESSKHAADSVEALFGITGGPLLDTLNQLISKGRAAQAAVAGATGATVTTAAGSGGGSINDEFARGGIPGGTTLGGIINQGTGSGLTPFGGTSQYDLGSMTFGKSGAGGGIMAPSGSPAPPAIEGPWRDVPSFARGGIVPGSGPVPIIAHGGEAIASPRTLVAAMVEGLREMGPRTVVNFHSGAVQQSGTVIQQDRDWSTLVETLSQAIAARAA